MYKSTDSRFCARSRSTRGRHRGPRRQHTGCTGKTLAVKRAAQRGAADARYREAVVMARLEYLERLDFPEYHRKRVLGSEFSEDFRRHLVECRRTLDLARRLGIAPHALMEATGADGNEIADAAELCGSDAAVAAAVTASDQTFATALDNLRPRQGAAAL